MALTRVIQEMIQGFDARTYNELTTGPDPTYPGAYGPNPSKQGLQFYANDSAGERKVFAAIETEIQDDTAGAVAGRLHFLTNDGNFLQVVGTVNRDGSWIMGPGAPSYIMQICGEQTVNNVVGPGAVFGERLSVEDPDYDDVRAFAVRNLKIADLTDLGYRVGMGFSILNSAGKERPTGHLRFQYSDRTANNEDSYTYFTTLRNGYQIDGPAISDGNIYPLATPGFPNTGDGYADLGKSTSRWRNLYIKDNQYIEGAIYFGPSGTPGNGLSDYEEGTWTPTILGASGNPTVTYLQQIGNYTKIGRQVTVNCLLQATVTGSGAGELQIGGLPFVAANTIESSGSISYASILADGYSPLGVQNVKNVNKARFYAKQSTSALSPMFTTINATTTELGNGYLYFSLTYIV